MGEQSLNPRAPNGRATQETVLAYIKEVYEKEGIPPTQRQIANHFGVYQNTIEWHMSKLAEAGKIRKAAGRFWIPSRG